MARALDRASDVFGNRGRQLDEFAACTFEREAVLVFTACGIRTQRGNAATACGFDRLRPPFRRRAVNLGRQPFFYVPAIHGGILRLSSELDEFAKQRTGRITLLEFSANPREAIPSPHGAIVRLAKGVAAAGKFE